MDWSYHRIIPPICRIGFFVAFLYLKQNIGGKIMGYYSDPTASMAIGNINREFSRLEKKAKKIREALKSGKISPEALEKARAEYKGIYAHVLDNILEEEE